MGDYFSKPRLVLVGLTAGYLVMAGAFALGRGMGNHPTAAKFAGAPAPNPGTVRISAKQLKASGGDTSGLDCYACHDEKKPPTVKAEPDGSIILPKEHADLIFAMRNCVSCHGDTKVEVKYDAEMNVQMPKAHQDLLKMGHGRNNRNDTCYNCHNPAKLNELVTRSGDKLTFDQAPLLCASCHGPTYRDWESGVHGRTTGFWDRTRGPIVREDCNSCHDPHAPAFPKIIPLPPPRPLRNEH